MNDKTRFTRSSDLVSTVVDGETVMMSIEKGEYFGIGGVGSRAWELLESPVTLDEIVTTLCAEYDVDASTCKQDMEAFIGRLLQDGLVNSL